MPQAGTAITSNLYWVGRGTHPVKKGLYSRMFDTSDIILHEITPSPYEGPLQIERKIARLTSKHANTVRPIVWMELCYGIKIVPRPKDESDKHQKSVSDEYQSVQVTWLKADPIPDDVLPDSITETWIAVSKEYLNKQTQEIDLVTMRILRHAAELYSSSRIQD